VLLSDGTVAAIAFFFFFPWVQLSKEGDGSVATIAFFFFFFYLWVQLSEKGDDSNATVTFFFVFSLGVAQ